MVADTSRTGSAGLDLASLAAYLLGGTHGRPLDADEWERFAASVGDVAATHAVVDWLASRRLAGEAAASPRLEASGLPRAVRRALAVERARGAAAAATREATLERCGRALARAGIAALLYKGTAVVRLCHGDGSRRPMTDLDLIVKPEHRRLAREALLAAGLAPTTGDTALHDVLVDSALAGPGHPRGTAVELHEDVFRRPHPFELDLEAMRERATPDSVPGLLVPHPVDALILSAWHLVLYERDGRKSWMSLRDLALLGDEAGLARGFEGAVALAQAAAHADLVPVVHEALRRAEQHAGAVPWRPGLVPRFVNADLRRRLVLRLVVSEMDRTLDSRPVPPDRVLPGTFVAATWPASTLDAVRATWNALLKRKAGGLGTRAGWLFRRYRGAFGRNPAR